MADHKVPLNAIAAHDVTLTANTVERFTFPDNVDAVEILSDGAEDIYFTLDGSSPVVAGPNTYRIQAVMGSTVVTPTAYGPTTVALISSGSPNVSVGRINA